MLSLYFNCRITGQKRTPDRVDAGYFYPVTTPQKAGAESQTQYSVLLKTIESYAVFQFDVVIFNIALDCVDNNVEDVIKTLIKDSYSAKKIVVRFTRPSTIDAWKVDVTEASSLIERNSPVLVIMNHDHPFVDYSSSAFSVLVEKVFPEKENNLGKALYYSHAPEVISWAVNGRGGTKFVKQCWGGYKSEEVNHWIDSICVMTLETLDHIWSRAKHDGNYIGRLDWADVQYSQLALTFYVFPREFFKHFDGYGHLTGMKLISDISASNLPILQFPRDHDATEIVEFYYQRWLDCFSLSIRDTIRNKAYSIESQKRVFVSAIEDSLNSFRVGYLEADANLGLINEDRVNLIECALRSNIYYFGNSLYDEIKTDIILMEGDAADEIKKQTPLFLLKYFRILCSLISKVIRKVRFNKGVL